MNAGSEAEAIAAAPRDLTEKSLRPNEAQIDGERRFPADNLSAIGRGQRTGKGAVCRAPGVDSLLATN